MSDPLVMTFPSMCALAHGFTLRHPTIDVNAERGEAVSRLTPWHESVIAALGYPVGALRTVEQVHGSDIAIVDGTSPAVVPGADGLITDQPDVLLGIYVADCGAVFLADEQSGAVGLVHSGKKGTELGIVPAAIRLMGETFGSRPENIIVQLSPCIRPPAYEVDFAAQIRSQCLAAGILVGHLHDGGICTSSDPGRYYSYRLEKGRTGRMLALLGKRPT